MNSHPPAPSVTAPRQLGTFGVCISAVALVVSASTLSTDFAGVATLGGGYLAALAFGLVAVALVVVSTCDLALAHPRAGGIYHYTRAVLGRGRGQQIGLFLALLFFCTFLCGAAAETKVTAEIVRQAVGSPAPVGVFVVIIGLCALVPNLFGLRSAAWVTGALLVAMLGVRWGLGLAGFCGWSPALQDWSAGRVWSAADAGGWNASLFAPALSLGLWTFVGLEGSCALVEEVRRPARTLPRALALALGVILATSAVLTLGLGGALPRAAWHQFMDTTAQGGPPLPIVVGEALFGRAGAIAMAVAAFASTASTLIIALAAVPRMLMTLARDGLLLGSLSPVFARVSPRNGTPVAATLLVGAIYLTVALTTGSSLRGVYAAAYLYFFRYAVLHLLALWNSRSTEREAFRAPRRLTAACAIAGVVVTLGVWPLAFAGRHATFAATAGVFAASAAVVACGSWLARPGHRTVAPGLAGLSRLKVGAGLGSGVMRRKFSPPLRQSGTILRGGLLAAGSKLR